LVDSEEISFFRKTVKKYLYIDKQKTTTLSKKNDKATTLHRSQAVASSKQSKRRIGSGGLGSKPYQIMGEKH
jgi:hypothetical protein